MTFEQAYQDDATHDMHLQVLRERRDWLNARITAKASVGWDIEYDERECDALTYIINRQENA